MIPVEFKLEKGEDYYAHLKSCRQHMPWLDFLCDKCYRMEIVEHFEPVTYRYIVRYCFYLSPEKETFYRLKFPS